MSSFRGRRNFIAAEPDCAGRIANANGEGDPKGERHGWRESIHLDGHRERNGLRLSPE
jgi:hypothetical protein